MRPADALVGEYLVEHGQITGAQLESALRIQREWRSHLGYVLIAKGWVRPQDWYRAVASAFALPFVDLMREAPEPDLLRPEDAETYASLLVIPWRRQGDKILVATAFPGPQAVRFARERFGTQAEFVVTSKFDIIWTVQQRFEPQLSHNAVFALADRTPEFSAREVITPAQIIGIYLLGSAVVLGFAFDPVSTFIALGGAMALFYLVSVLFRSVLLYVGDREGWASREALDRAVRDLKDEQLPVFTILVPMFREPEVLPILANALRSLDYPLSRLDIKLVLEESDTETVEAAKQLGLEGNFEIIRVPRSMPQTKPKACNYALTFARGEYCVVFDAEDKPEPDQLKKVVATFRMLPPEYVCLQCRLNYYNREENWLTRLFTLDYSLWFDFMLPGLQRLGIPIPLGGTSNHFKLSVLREMEAWDPFNVTEDCDLGLRLAQAGYKVGMVDSTTFEEANVSIGNWIRQRSRWIKGYMQTYLVHMRDPVKLYRSLGPSGFLGFQFFVGGAVLTVLVNPLFWLMFLAWLVTFTTGLDELFPPLLLYISLFNLLIGNAAFTYMMLISPVERGWIHLAPWGLTAVLYWMLMSVAGYKALWQLVVNPFYWEKTQHGLSKQIASELAAAGMPPNGQQSPATKG
ncbi:MAG: glycosyltransferase [Alphaproteobacteria bacterium]|nr:glycosyltransferase [Alphaproteobacteria bacterium]